MIKSVKPIFVVLVFSSLISFSFMEKKDPTEKLVPGDTLPIPVLENEKQTLNLQAVEGKYTLLSFWAGYDAKSRMKNAELCHALQNSDRIKMISVSLDSYESVFRAAVEQDQLQTALCYLETGGNTSEVFKEFGLRDGFANYLIDDNGVIVAKNVTADELNSYMN